MAKIAVDIDDSLYSFTDEAREVLSVMVDEYPQYGQLSHALYANWDQWRTPFELCGEDDEGNSLWLECIARCHDDERILAQQPFNGAVEVLNELHDEGHDFVYISNRATETEQATADWLVQCGFPSGARHTLVVTSGDKRPFIRDCQYMIDDRVKTVIEFVYDHDWYNRTTEQIELLTKQGVEIDELAYRAADARKAFVRVAGYNSGLTDVPGLYLAHTWRGLSRYMVKCGLIPKTELVSV